MDVGPLRQFFPDPLNRASPVADLRSRGHPEDDKVTAGNRLQVAGKALTDQRGAKQSAGLAEKRRIRVAGTAKQNVSRCRRGGAAVQSGSQAVEAAHRSRADWRPSA